MPPFPYIDPPLSGPGARVRVTAERDIPDILIAHQDDPGLHLALGADDPPSGAELGRRIEREAADRAAGTGVWLTITEQTGSDACCGQVVVHDVDWDHRRAGLGIWVVPARRRGGLGSTALGLVGRWLLMVCGLMRVELLTELDNEALTRAATAAGFLAEGVLRSYRRAGGRSGGRSGGAGGQTGGQAAGRAGGRAGGGRLDVRVLSLVASDVVAP